MTIAVHLIALHQVRRTSGLEPQERVSRRSSCVPPPVRRQLHLFGKLGKVFIATSSARDRPAADYPTEASTCGIPLHSGRLQVVRQPRHRGEECTYRGRASPVPTIRAHARLGYQECAERHWAFQAKLQSCRQSLPACLELSSLPPRDRSHAHVYSHLDREAVPWHRRT